MTAKEMFEKLGFKREKNEGDIYYYKGNSRFKKEYIAFRKIEKTICLYNYYTPHGNDIENIQFYTNGFELFKAINKQVEELGWLRGEDNGDN